MYGNFKTLHPPSSYLTGTFLNLLIFSLCWVAQDCMQYSRCDPTTGVVINSISEIAGIRDMFLQYHRSQHKFTFRDKATLSHFPRGKLVRMYSMLIISFEQNTVLTPASLEILQDISEDTVDTYFLLFLPCSTTYSWQDTTTDYNSYAWNMHWSL